MSKKAILATSTGTGVAGYVVGRLTSTDLRHLLDKLLDGMFGFLRMQGPYVAYALVIAGCFGAFSIWALRQLVQGKQAEIDRLVTERDRFQMLFVEEWQSSKRRSK